MSVAAMFASPQGYRSQRRLAAILNKRMNWRPNCFNSFSVRKNKLFYKNASEQFDSGNTQVSDFLPNRESDFCISYGTETTPVIRDAFINQDQSDQDNLIWIKVEP